MAENQAKRSEEKTYRERDLEERIRDFRQMKRKHPDKIPAIIERHPMECLLNKLYQKRFTLCVEDKLPHLAQRLRLRLKLTSTQSIFLLVNNAKVSNSLTLGEVYNDHKADDGLLYITYASQESFG